MRFPKSAQLKADQLYHPNLRKRNHNFQYNCIKYLKNYAENSTVHGISYLQENRSTFEKIFWAIILIISFSGCTFMISQIWNKYESNPIVISFGSEPKHIDFFPFPAITICPESKIDATRYNMSAILEMNDEDIEKINAVLFMCEDYDESFTYKVTEDFYKMVEEAHMKMDLIFEACIIQTIYVDCSEMFIPIFTETGLCYSFNMLDKTYMFRENILPHTKYYNVNIKSAWDLEKGYQSDDLYVYPYRISHSGPDFGALEVRLHTFKTAIDTTCDNAAGYRIMIHPPNEIPMVINDYFILPYSKLVAAEIEPNYIITSKQVQGYTPTKRQCYFQHERSLQYFKIYSPQFCKLECMTNYLLKNCGCVEFHMPRTNGTKICGTEDIDCVILSDVKMIDAQHQNLHKKEFDCDCKPLCTSLKYEATIYQTPIELEQDFEIPMLSEDLDIINSKLMIYFKNEDILILERNELYGISDLISNFGGLLGLFIGFSMISLVEFIYFLTLRIFCNQRLYFNWAGPVGITTGVSRWARPALNKKLF